MPNPYDSYNDLIRRELTLAEKDADKWRERYYNLKSLKDAEEPWKMYEMHCPQCNHVSYHKCDQLFNRRE